MNTPNKNTALEELFLSVDLRLRLLELKMDLLAGETTEDQFKAKGLNLYSEIIQTHRGKKSKSAV